MSGREDLLARLAGAIAETPVGHPLSARLCHACRNLAGADSAAITLDYLSANRVTLCATDETASRLEDLQDVVGEGPGRTAAETGRVEVCPLPWPGRERWAMFAEAAEKVVDQTVIHAVPIQPGDSVLGVLTLYLLRPAPAELLLDERTLLTMAAATGAALARDPGVFQDDLLSGPWSSRARIHQATGMVIAQLGLNSDDALAVLRAHAYAGETTLTDIAEEVVSRRLRFTNP
ncbi:ANTAR domain-containing protein [Nocardioides sp.]|uniref:ANTAR domain-containing protein n=1 Tax=Nocardioides sp. TaxID=35761 RepID=UPI003D0B36B8